MQARFCSNCGTVIDPNKKFCSNCGTAIEQNDAPPAYEPQQAPPVYNQPPPQQAPPVYNQPPPQQAPPAYNQPPQATPMQPVFKEKSKKKGGKGKKILLGIIGVIALVIIGASLATGRTANADYIKLGNDQIPSVKLVVGKRDVGGVETGTSGGVQYTQIDYKAGQSTQQDLKEYIGYLLYNEGFAATVSFNIDNIPGTLQIAKESVDAGKLIFLDVEYDRNGYVITYSKMTGSLERY